ncbi:O-fucosyltransferase 16 isoform X2 [Musa acuminata AAA Group]|uniref:O-fucosyltransferase 16 isoform X2 n=1 Tax=Musa acuminata AAA Group TaxID=214697 RepID=UPI0031DC6AD5
MRLPRRRHHPLRCPIPAASAVSFLSTAVAVLLLALALLSYLAPPPFLDHPSVSGHRLRHSDPSPVRKPKISRDAAVRRDATTGESFRVPVRHGGGSSKNDLWGSKLSKNYVGCSNASIKFPAEAVIRRDRYLMIGTSGGLNQQRTGITDAVVAARILNATLVVPKLDQRSFWKDASNFGDIFDVNWFISFLSKDVKIIKELPKKGGKPFRGPYTMRVPRKCTPRCYQNRVLPVLLKKHVVQLTKFDYRLANKLETDLQKLRCRVNYHALKFTHPIQDMGDKLIHRMKEKGKHFIALHLRYEPDMLAFSGCYYGGGEKERKELGAIRKRWKTLHISNPDKARRQGRCPLTPEEVGLMLRALGYGSDVHIYVASGEIYGGDESLAPLKALFPNFHSKETLASKEELEPFSLFSSRMAALDFIVCDGSDAFVANNNGNMARMLTGRRRYFGHKRTLRPNAKKLYSLFLNRANMTWEQFSLKVYSYQRGFLGEPKEVRPGRGEFHENPSACICETTKAMRGKHSGSLSQTNGDDQHRKSNRGHSISEPTYDHTDEEPDWSDMDYGEYTPFSKSLSNSTDMDYNPFTRPEDSELEDFLSD